MNHEKIIDILEKVAIPFVWIGTSLLSVICLVILYFTVGIFLWIASGLVAGLSGTELIETFAKSISDVSLIVIRWLSLIIGGFITYLMYRKKDEKNSNNR